MKKTVILLIPAFVLATSIRVGDVVLFEGEDGLFLYPEKLFLVLNVVSDFLGYPPPIIGEDRLVFNGESLFFDHDEYEFDGVKVEKGFFRADNILDAFGVPFTMEGRDVVIPECVLKDVDLVSNAVRVSYTGNPAFVYRSTGESIVIVSTGFVFYEGWVRKPGEVLKEFPLGGARVGSVFEFSDHDVVVLSLKESFRNLIIADFGGWRGKPVSPRDLLVLIGKGNGKVVVRPVSKDLGGVDVSSFEVSEKIGKELADRLGYDFEICPLLDVPVGANSIVVLTEEGTGLILHALEGVVDFSHIIDLTNSLGN